MISYQGAHAAVLGGSGFIGRWVARKLRESGACVSLVTRKAASLGSQAGVVEIDLTDSQAVAGFYTRARPCITFNLAGYGVDPAERDEAVAWRINAEIPRTLCECVARSSNPSWGGMQIVHAGSVAEYGSAGGDLREDGPAQPLTAYGKSKLEGSTIIADYASSTGLRAVTARLFSVYGPGEPAGRLLPALIETSRTGQPLDMTTGSQRRDFTYIEDVAEGLLRLGLSSGQASIVNLATGRLTTVRDFAEIAAGILQIPSRHLRFGTRPDGPHEMEHEPVSLARLRNLTGWAPATTIPEGIRSSVEIGLLRQSGN
jgi:UDP-glucose 4-epimerase